MGGTVLEEMGTVQSQNFPLAVSRSLVGNQM